MFSIIIPTLNNLEYLKFCIYSIKKNSKFNHEIIPHVNIGNDGTIDYDIVITRQNFSTGYNLTRMTCMITSVYFSSEPTREQLRGRINRLDQNNPKIEYITVIVGILELVHNNYERVKLISRCLQHGEDLKDLAETLSQDNIIGQMVHYFQKNVEDIIMGNQPEKKQRMLSTDPYVSMMKE